MSNNKSLPFVSIIIRTKNEEKWIGHCLSAIYTQNFSNFEVILVDNMSTDGTINKALTYPIKIVTIDDFFPGKAINDGIRESKGEVVVIISGHCIPVNQDWLGNLLKNINKKGVGGVYGRQEPLSFSSSLDKRGLAITFGLDAKTQTKDSFFHNANSAIKRSVWEEFPFDEKATNIEDRIWGKKIIESGLKIYYEPSASVYHYHGIHQGRNLERAHKIVRIMEDLHGSHKELSNISENSVQAVAIIPIRGESISCNGEFLLPYTLKYLQKCKLISSIVVSTDNEKTAELAKKYGAKVPFIRPQSLSEEYVDIAQVLSYTLEELEKNETPDLVLIVEETQPFRSKGLVDDMILEIMNKGLDSIVAVHKEERSVWSANNNNIDQTGEIPVPRTFKKNSTNINLMGLGCITHPQYIRDQTLFGSNIGLHIIDCPISALEIRSSETMRKIFPLLDKWNME